MAEEQQQDNPLTLEEQMALNEYYTKFGAPTADPKYNVHTFLNMIANSKDTTKLGYLKEEEIGNMLHTVRANKTASLISKEIMGNDALADYFMQKSEITSATSLSRQGFLAKLAVVQKKEIADLTPEKKENKGWFKKKDNNQPDSSI